jgi:N-acetylneuraminic acid mutarotase
MPHSVPIVIGRRQLLLACASLAVATQSSSAEGAGTWSAVAPLPVAKFGHHSSVIDGQVYSLGGNSLSAGNTGTGMPTGGMHVYDPARDRWSEAPAMPTARGFFATGAIDGKLYAVGGSLNIEIQDPGVGILEIYDPETRAWSRGADMPTPRADLTVGVVDGKLYAIGGTRHVAIEALGTVEAYDPKTDAWTRKADMPTPRLHLACGVVDGKIIVAGGATPEWPVPSGACEMYDPAADAWAKLADMPTPRGGVWAAELDGKVYVMGGVSWENEALPTVEEFDPKTNSWRAVADMPTPRMLFTAEAAGGRIYAIGGAASDFGRHDAVEMFTP